MRFRSGEFAKPSTVKSYPLAAVSNFKSVRRSQVLVENEICIFMMLVSRKKRVLYKFSCQMALRTLDTGLTPIIAQLPYKETSSSKQG